MTRRLVSRPALFVLAGVLGAACGSSRDGAAAAGSRTDDARFAPDPPLPEPEHSERFSDAPSSEHLTLTETEWRARLSAEEFRILRQRGTERAFSGALHDHHAAGVYRCAGCGAPLFDARHKFDSGTGWPSFDRPIEGRVGREEDTSFGIRVEVHCERCGGHLGHVFEDGPDPTGLRYCINSMSLDFEPK